MYDINIPVIKTTSALLCLTDKEAQVPPQTNCIRCGKCVEHCPMGLVPLELNQYSSTGKDELYIKNHGLDCIECGCSTYICPVKRQITQTLRTAKRRILAARKK